MPDNAENQRGWLPDGKEQAAAGATIVAVASGFVNNGDLDLPTTAVPFNCNAPGRIADDDGIPSSGAAGNSGEIVSPTGGCRHRRVY